MFKPAKPLKEIDISNRIANCKAAEGGAWCELSEGTHQPPFKAFGRKFTKGNEDLSPSVSESVLTLRSPLGNPIQVKGKIDVFHVA